MMYQTKQVIANGTTLFTNPGSNSRDIDLQATIEGSGAITATVNWYVSIDGVGYVLLATQTISGTSTATDIQRGSTACPSLKAVVSGLSANTQLTLGFAV